MLFRARRRWHHMSDSETRRGDVLFWVVVTACSAVWVVAGVTLSAFL